MKQIIIDFKNGSQATYEVPDDELQNFFESVYVMLFDNILSMRLTTIERENVRIRKN